MIALLAWEAMGESASSAPPRAFSTLILDPGDDRHQGGSRFAGCVPRPASSRVRVLVGFGPRSYGGAIMLKVLGAGVGRTGTHSLKVALETLLGGACHHMVEVFAHPGEVPIWIGAVTDSQSTGMLL